MVGFDRKIRFEFSHNVKSETLRKSLKVCLKKWCEFLHHRVVWRSKKKSSME